MATKTDAKKVSAGLAAAAAAAGAAAGYYFHASKDAKDHRKKSARWASDMKREVVLRARKLKKMERAQLLKIIDSAAAAYETARAIDQDDLRRAAQELKENWILVAQEASGKAKHAARNAASAAKQAKKIAKKSAKKRR